MAHLFARAASRYCHRLTRQLNFEPLALRCRVQAFPTVFCVRSTSSEPSEGYRYLKSHEWTSLGSDGTATVGISNYAQEKLGEIVYVEFPDVGETLNAGEQLGVLESVKAAADVYSPISGEVTEVNEKLIDEPELINKDPYASGWLVKLKATDPNEYDSLLTPEEYREVLEESD